MVLRVQAWDAERIQMELANRLKLAREYRSQFEMTWRENENILYNAIGYREAYNMVSFNEFVEEPEEDSDIIDVGVNYTFRTYRFLHAQMSANPPIVQISPTSFDKDDIIAAELADSLVHWLHVKHILQEVTDAACGKALSKGTSWIKTVWDADRGEAASFDPKTGDLTMTGEEHVYSPSTWDVWVDPDATEFWKSCGYVFERHVMRFEVAEMMFPDFADKLRKATKMHSEVYGFWSKQEEKRRGSSELVEVFEYYEKASPVNGMAGRHCWCMDDGTPLRPMQKNPHPKGLLPYHILTDVDVEDQVYGKSFLEYEVPMQDVLNRLDGYMLDNAKIHGRAALVTYEGFETGDGSFTNATDVVIKGTGSHAQAPHYISPPGQMPDMVALRQNLERGVDIIGGTNDAMYGKVSGEMSGYAAQTAINAGNMIRRRLFNKYTLMVESMYKHLLMLVVAHWKEKRMIKVAGKEQSTKVVYLKGSDIESGWDLKGEYGTSMSLDPESRREEVMQLHERGLLEQFGITGPEIAKILRLNNVKEVFHRADASRERQREEFDKMIEAYNKGNELFIEPEDLQDHQNRLEYCYDFLESSEFKQLKPELQEMLKEHTRRRRQMALEEAAPQAAQQPQQGQPAQAAAGGQMPPGAGVPPELMGLG